jgi:hypothetical protein
LGLVGRDYDGTIESIVPHSQSGLCKRAIEYISGEWDDQKKFEECIRCAEMPKETVEQPTGRLSKEEAIGQIMDLASGYYHRHDSPSTAEYYYQQICDASFTTEVTEEALEKCTIS